LWLKHDWVCCLQDHYIDLLASNDPCTDLKAEQCSINECDVASNNALFDLSFELVPPMEEQQPDMSIPENV
jgi:hypothetical protein